MRQQRGDLHGWRRDCQVSVFHRAACSPQTTTHLVEPSPEGTVAMQIATWRDFHGEGKGGEKREESTMYSDENKRLPENVDEAFHKNWHAPIRASGLATGWTARSIAVPHARRCGPRHLLCLTAPIRGVLFDPEDRVRVSAAEGKVMDSDVTADSLSSPEHGGGTSSSSTRGRESAFGSMLSFSNQVPPDHASSQRSSSAALDSFDLSPATDASTGGGGFLDGGSSSRHQRSSLSLHEAGELSPLSESRRSSGFLSREDEEDGRKVYPTRYGDITGSVHAEQGISRATGEVVVGVAPRDTRRGGAGRTRKRSREVATTDGRASVGLQQPQQHRLERSWPLFREQGPGVDGSSHWGMSGLSPSRSFSRRGGETSSPREYGSVPQVPRSHRREVFGTGDEASASGFSRGGESNGGESDGGRAGGGVGGGGGATNSNRGMSVSSSGGALSGGVGETFSVFSEVSSRGLPAPPPIPSGPLPVIGTIREVRRSVSPRT